MKFRPGDSIGRATRLFSELSRNCTVQIPASPRFSIRPLEPVEPAGQMSAPIDLPSGRRCRNDADVDQSRIGRNRNSGFGHLQGSPGCLSPEPAPGSHRVKPGLQPVSHGLSSGRAARLDRDLHLRPDRSAGTSRTGQRWSFPFARCLSGRCQSACRPDDLHVLPCRSSVRRSQARTANRFLEKGTSVRPGGSTRRIAFEQKRRDCLGPSHSVPAPMPKPGNRKWHGQPVGGNGWTRRTSTHMQACPESC